MAFPTIVYDAVGGSDTAASGAGPATAVTGIAGATTGADTAGISNTVIKLNGSPDLSGVTVDVDVLWLDHTAGTRHLHRITAVDDTLKTVTVEDAVTIANASAVAWAIGGKRKTLENDTTAVDGNDGKAGWTFEFNDGTYTQTIAMNPQAGDTTDGPVTYKATNRHSAIIDKTGAFRNWYFQTSASAVVIDGLKFTRSSGTSGGAHVIYVNTSNIIITFINNEVDGAGTDGAMYLNAFVHLYAYNNEFYGVDYAGTNTGGIRLGNRVHAIIENNSFHDLDTPAIWEAASTSYSHSTIRGNTIYNCEDGITVDGVSGTGASMVIEDNTINGCTGSGIDILDVSVGTGSGLVIRGNTITNNTTYGIKNTTGFAHGVKYNDYNNVWNNTVANYLNLTAGANSISADPLYINTTAGFENFTPDNGSPSIGLVPSGPIN